MGYRHMGREVREICESEAQKYGAAIIAWKPDRDGNAARVTFEKGGRRSVCYVPLVSGKDGTGTKRKTHIEAQKALVQIGAISLDKRRFTPDGLQSHQQLINKVFGAPNPGTMGEVLREALLRSNDELPPAPMPASEPSPDDHVKPTAVDPDHIALPPGLEPQPHAQVPNTGPTEPPRDKAHSTPFRGKTRDQAIQQMRAVRERAAADMRAHVERGNKLDVPAFAKAHGVTTMTVYNWIRRHWTAWLDVSRGGPGASLVLRLKSPATTETKEAAMTSTHPYTNGANRAPDNAITITQPASHSDDSNGGPASSASDDPKSRGPVFRPSRMQFADMVIYLSTYGRKADNGQYTYQEGFDDERVAKMIYERCPADQVKALRREKFGVLPGEVRRPRVSEEYVSELEGRIDRLEKIIAKWQPIVDQLA